MVQETKTKKEKKLYCGRCENFDEKVETKWKCSKCGEPYCENCAGMNSYTCEDCSPALIRII